MRAVRYILQSLPIRLITVVFVCVVAVSLLVTTTQAAVSDDLSSTPYRVYENDDSINPGLPLEAVDTPAGLPATGSPFRVRSGIKTQPSTGFSKVSSDVFALHICGIADGDAFCWGSNDNGQLGNNSTTQSLVPVAVSTAGVLSGKTVTDISVGTAHSCAVADGEAFCWGINTNGQLGNNSTTQSLVPVAVSTAGVLSGKTVTDISAGVNHTCAIADDEVFCWGLNGNGQLGNNSTTQSLVPVAVSPIVTQFTGNTVIHEYTIPTGITSVHVVVNGARGGNGGLGGSHRFGGRVEADIDVTGIPQLFSVLTSVGADTTLIAGAAGGVNSATNILNGGNGGSALILIGGGGGGGGSGVFHTSASKTNALVVAGGAGGNANSGTNGGLGGVTLDNQSVTPGNATNGASPLAGAGGGGGGGGWRGGTGGTANNGGQGGTSMAHSTLTSNVTSTSGVNNGAGSVTIRLNDPEFTSISSGADHTCAIANGQSYCWGLNTSGQLGNNSTTQSLVPVAVSTAGVLSGKTVTDISAGGAYSCTIADDEAFCWGFNNVGQLGNNSTTQSLVPVAVSTAGVLSGKTVTDVSAGFLSSCAIADDEVFCWGLNGNGQLGNNSTTQSLVPVAVSTAGVLSGKAATQIAVGAANACVVADEGAFCWGYNDDGQLGNNSTVQSLVPVTAIYTPIAIPSGGKQLKLRFAQKTAGTCSAQTTGFADVTASSAIAWYENPSVTHNTAITVQANDPTPSGQTTYQTYRSQAGNFSNNVDILPDTYVLWDFSLQDNSGTYNQSFCLKITYSDNSDLEQMNNFIEIITTNGELSLDIVDGSGDPVANPSYAFSPTLVQTSCQTTSGTFGTSSQQVRITNTDTTVIGGWSVSIAALDGATALWDRSDSGAQYDFNDPSGSPPGCNSGSDGDGYAGQLRLDPSVASASPESGCTNTGLSFGPSSGFDQGSIDAISIAIGSSATDNGCYWDVTDIDMEQSIPAAQPTGAYNIHLTITVVAL